MDFIKLNKLKPGDKVAVVSPSFAAPGKWPWVYELGLKRIKDVFGLEPVEFKFTKTIGASGAERSQDLINAFKDPGIKAVIATLGGDDQITYIKHLPKDVFINNPKPFFGYSDNTHFINFLWNLGIPAFYGANLFTEFAMQTEMDDFTVGYIKRALFEQGEFEISPSANFNDIGLNWGEVANLKKHREYEQNEGWYWDGDKDAKGILWGGCLESLDELLRHGIEIPTLEQLKEIILYFETSEEIPSNDYVHRVLRAFGERNWFENIQAVLVGRPKAWEFDKPNNKETKLTYKQKQRETVISTIRKYNQHIPIIQNLDFGHTAPQICLPSGGEVKVNSLTKKIFASF